MQTIDISFKYDGTTRHVSNCTFEGLTLIGFEMRRAGKFSYKIKRFSFDKISNLKFITPILRKGPRIGIPA